MNKRRGSIDLVARRSANVATAATRPPLANQFPLTANRWRGGSGARIEDWSGPARGVTAREPELSSRRYRARRPYRVRVPGFCELNASKRDATWRIAPVPCNVTREHVPSVIERSRLEIASFLPFFFLLPRRKSRTATAHGGCARKVEQLAPLARCRLGLSLLEDSIVREWAFEKFGGTGEFPHRRHAGTSDPGTLLNHYRPAPSRNSPWMCVLMYICDCEYVCVRVRGRKRETGWGYYSGRSLWVQLGSQLMRRPTGSLPPAVDSCGRDVARSRSSCFVTDSDSLTVHSRALIPRFAF